MAESQSARVLIISQYGLPSYKKNMNAYQRLYYGSRHAAITLLVRKTAEVSEELRERIAVERAPVGGRLLFFLYAAWFTLAFKRKGGRIIITDPSSYALVGYLANKILGYFWVMDLWDRPMWRGKHEAGDKPSLHDRIVFRIMKCADLSVLSCLPRAVKDIDPPLERCVQFCNAIDLAGMATKPPVRNGSSLHAAMARFKVTEREGFTVLLRAMEVLSTEDPDITIHIVGNLDERCQAALDASPARKYFQVQGFTTQSRVEFFESIHIGLVPYLGLEDMSYIFPIKVLEHLSQGNVVLASRVPGIATMVEHEENGLLFEPGDASDLARQLSRLWRDHSLWERLAWGAIRSIKAFDVVEKNRSIFEEIHQRAGVASLTHTASRRTSECSQRRVV